MNKSIEDRIPYWAEEFANRVSVAEHNLMISMAIQTIIYEIADNFRNGEFREEILKQFGDQ
jgi:hypothetical protein